MTARTAAGAHGQYQVPARPSGADSDSTRGSCVHGRVREEGRSPPGALRAWGTQPGPLRLSASSPTWGGVSIISSVLLPPGPQAETVWAPWSPGHVWTLIGQWRNCRGVLWEERVAEGGWGAEAVLPQSAGPGRGKEGRREID